MKVREILSVLGKNNIFLIQYDGDGDTGETLYGGRSETSLSENAIDLITLREKEVLRLEVSTENIGGYSALRIIVSKCSKSK